MAKKYRLEYEGVIFGSFLLVVAILFLAQDVHNDIMSDLFQSNILLIAFAATLFCYGAQLRIGMWLSPQQLRSWEKRHPRGKNFKIAYRILLFLLVLTFAASMSHFAKFIIATVFPIWFAGLGLCFAIIRSGLTTRRGYCARCKKKTSFWKVGDGWVCIDRDHPMPDASKSIETQISEYKAQRALERKRQALEDGGIAKSDAIAKEAEPKVAYPPVIMRYIPIIKNGAIAILIGWPIVLIIGAAIVPLPPEGEANRCFLAPFLLALFSPIWLGFLYFEGITYAVDESGIDRSYWGKWRHVIIKWNDTRGIRWDVGSSTRIRVLYRKGKTPKVMCISSRYVTHLPEFCRFIEQNVPERKWREVSDWIEYWAHGIKPQDDAEDRANE